MERLRVRFPHALALRFAPTGGEDAARDRPPRPAGPRTTIALDFVSHVRGDAGDTAPSPSCCRPRSSAAPRTPTSWSERDAVGERLMRLHELSITAFGPFVDTVHVDFDELAAGGLFLLTGDTGAGKTSVLDAVCFALLRRGARRPAQRATPAQRPRRPLGRAAGACCGSASARAPSGSPAPPPGTDPSVAAPAPRRVQAHVVVEEHRGGEWVALTNRLDEAGQLVTDLLGMTCTQFTQVAMLPQGRFQAFLRATSPERHAVLQRLFRTRRFEEVERWLVDRRVALRRRSQDCHDRSAGVVSRIQEAAGVGAPRGVGPARPRAGRRRR